MGILALIALFATIPAADIKEADVLALDRGFDHAILTSDIEFLSRVMSPDFKFTHGDGNSQSKSEIIDAVRAGRLRSKTRDVDEQAVEIHGDIALVSGRVHVVRDNPDPARRDYSVWYIRVYAKRADGLQLISHRTERSTLPVQAAVYRIDHILLGIADLDRGTAEFEQLTGVKPVFGGKHPRGTQNALVSFGDGTYLELIAPQPGESVDDLKQLDHLAPIGWAVSASDLVSLKKIVPVTEPQAGSRTTPAGAVLRWQTANPATPIQGAPFFIAWAPGTPHPSTTSPRGCSLVNFDVQTPDADALRPIVSALALSPSPRVTVAKTATHSIALDCPKGRVVFASTLRR
jgi:ketosteroid isomerase-like protein